MEGPEAGPGVCFDASWLTHANLPGLDYPGMVLGRKKDTPDDSLAPPSTISADDVGQIDVTGKGRPTPTRKEAEAKNRRPLVQSDPKIAKAEQRKASSEARTRMNEAMVTGDERYLPLQHRGPQRRFIRDYIDARWSIGEFFLPIAFIFVIGTLLVNNRPEFAFPLIIALYSIVAIAIIDAVLVGRRVRKRLAGKFGEEKLQKGGVMYAVMRSFQMRPTRMPKPQVKRGEFPV